MSMSSAPTVATEEDSPDLIALDRLIAEQERIFLDRTGQSLRLT